MDVYALSFLLIHGKNWLEFISVCETVFSFSVHLSVWFIFSYFLLYLHLTFGTFKQISSHPNLPSALLFLLGLA